MKSLNGAELAQFIKERQAKQVRSLRQAHGIEPRLAIIKVVDDPIIETYVRLKKRYGNDIGVQVDLHDIEQAEVERVIAELNTDTSVHGIIVQLPLADTSTTQDLLNLVERQKDVDGLAEDTDFTAATALSITWLLDGYNVSLHGKKIVVVGKGRLVGAPLVKALEDQRLNPLSFDERDGDIRNELKGADVLISATGTPNLISSDDIKQGAVVVDAGVATDGKKAVGDLADDVYQRDDLTITPKKGGVGPLTVCALFENVLRAASGQLV